MLRNLSKAMLVLVAARLAGVTTTIIMLVPHEGSPIMMIVSRVSEVTWGVCVAVFNRLDYQVASGWPGIGGGRVQ